MTKDYLKAYAGLYGSTPYSTTTKKRSSNGGKRKQPERDEQIKLATWLTKEGILFYAIPNGGWRHELEAFNLKRQGVKAGVPDICVPIRTKDYAGLYVELKAIGGIVSDLQQYWIKELNNRGYLAKVCYGFLEAKKVICTYLGLEVS